MQMAALIFLPLGSLSCTVCTVLVGRKQRYAANVVYSFTAYLMIPDTSFQCGIIAHDFPTTITFGNLCEGRSQESLLKLWLVVTDNEEETKGTGWLSRADFKKLLVPHRNGLIVNSTATFMTISCGSTTNIGDKCLLYVMIL